MTGKATTDRIILSMARMLDRGLAEFTHEQLAKDSGFHSKTIRTFIHKFKGINIELVSDCKAGGRGRAATYQWIASDIKPVKVKRVSRKALAEKWSKLAVSPEIASLGKFRAVGNVYNLG